MLHIFRSSIILLTISVCSGLLFGQAKSPKRGIAYGSHSAADMEALKDGVGWWYNWYHQPESPVMASYQSYGLEYVPMAWNGSFNKEQLRQFLTDHPDVKYLLGWNEPNFLAQANMTPSDAAAKWKDLEGIADEFELELVSPAVNYCGECVSENGTTYNDPIVYLDDFFKACAGCRVDHIAIHSYMGNVGALQWYVGLFKKYGKPIWLTEFANWENNPTLAQQKSFLIGAVDYLENDADVLKYAWFTGRHSGAPFIGILENNMNGVLTELGEIYVSMPIHDPDMFTTIPSKIEAEQYNSMSGILLEATADESGFANVGYIEKDDWLEYSIEVPEEKNYPFSLRIASTAQASVQILVDGVAQKSIALPNTTGWQTWQTIKTDIDLSSGKHTVRLQAETSGFNINWFEIGELATSVEPGNSITKLTFPNPVTDKIKVMNFQSESVELVDAFGKSFEVPVSSGEADVTFLPAGLYLLRMKYSNGAIHTEKLLKN
jgi:hypothetical protein